MSIAYALGMLLSVAAASTALLVSIGAISPARPAPPKVELPFLGWLDFLRTSETLWIYVAALTDYLWNFADAVPVLQLTRALEWRRPGYFAGDRLESLLLVVFTVAAAVPVFAFIAHALRTRDAVTPEPPVIDDIVRGVVVERVAASPKAWSVSGHEDRQKILEHAAAQLNNAAVTPPEGASAWSSRAIAAALKLDVY